MSGFKFRSFNSDSQPERDFLQHRTPNPKPIKSSGLKELLSKNSYILTQTKFKSPNIVIKNSSSIGSKEISPQPAKLANFARLRNSSLLTEHHGRLSKHGSAALNSKKSIFQPIHVDGTAIGKAGSARQKMASRGLLASLDEHLLHRDSRSRNQSRELVMSNRSVEVELGQKKVLFQNLEPAPPAQPPQAKIKFNLNKTQRQGAKPLDRGYLGVPFLWKEYETEQVAAYGVNCYVRRRVKLR